MQMGRVRYLFLAVGCSLTEELFLLTEERCWLLAISCWLLALSFFFDKRTKEHKVQCS